MALNLIIAKSRIENNQWDSITLLNHTKEALKKAVNLFSLIPEELTNHGKILNDASFHKAVYKSLFLHDLGKICWEFQCNILKHIKGYQTEQSSIQQYLDATKDISLSGRHEYYSVLWSLVLLNNETQAPLIRTAILYHHFNDFYAVNTNEGLKLFEGFEDEAASYLTFIKRISSQFKNIFIENVFTDFEDKTVKEAIGEIKESFEAVNIDDIITAFKSRENVSEYVQLYDSHLTNIENKNIFCKEEYYFLLLLGCLRRSDYSSSAHVEIEKPFIALLKSILPNVRSKISSDNWQEKVLHEMNNGQEAFILKAPTGSGKTEFALLWANKQNRKVFYTLPVRIALNDIYQGRIVNQKNGYLKEHPSDVSLLHSTAFLEYLKQKSDLDIGEKENISRMLANSFYLSTVDQLFLTSLLYYGADKLFAIYPYSSFVIDEIQSYNPEMMAVIFKTIQHIQQLGGAILIITATLPPYLSDVFRFLQIKYNLIEISYIKDEIKNYKRRRHKIKVNPTYLCKYEPSKEKSEDQNFSIIINEDEIIEITQNRESYNTLVILNNVSKAITIFQQLQNRLKINEQELNTLSSKLYLLHSRLIESEKSRRIDELKTYNQKGLIVVSTQLIEASVDFDFDRLYTELSPIDSQIQRWGRIFRNRESDYLENNANIIIYSGDNEAPFDKLTMLIYDKDVLSATKQKLENAKANIVYDYETTSELLSAVFNTKLQNENDSINSIYLKKIKNNLDFLRYFKASKKSDAQKIFRRLAGRSLVILNGLGECEESKIFGEFLKDKYESYTLSEINNTPWNQLQKQIMLDLNNFNYTARKWLIENSVQIPEYYFHKIGGVRQFKEFSLLLLDDKSYKLIKTYGFDMVRKDLEKKELGEII